MNIIYSYFVRVCPNSFVKSVLIEHFPFVILCIWCVQCVQATIKERAAAGATTAQQVRSTAALSGQLLKLQWWPTTPTVGRVSHRSKAVTTLPAQTKSLSSCHMHTTALPTEWWKEIVWRVVLIFSPRDHCRAGTAPLLPEYIEIGQLCSRQ